MKTLKAQLFQNLLNKGLNAVYEKSDDVSLYDDSILMNKFDIQLGNGYVIIYEKLENDKLKVIWDNKINNKNINIVSDYIANLINK